MGFRAALRAHHDYKLTAHHALDLGLRPVEIVCYVQGDLSDLERTEFQGLLAQSPWAMSRVAALVKARRNRIREKDSVQWANMSDMDAAAALDRV